MSRPALHHLFHPAHASQYVHTLRGGLDHLAAALLRVEGPSTGTPPDVAERRVREVNLDLPLGDPQAALDEMSRLWLDDAVWFHEPTYAAHLNCPVVIPALLAEVFVSAVNSSLDTFDQSVGGTFVERHLIEWTAGRVGYGAGADGVFTSGGTQSNLQALLLARGRAQENGVPLGRLRILASVDSHFSVQKSARLLGLGSDGVITVATDTGRRLDPVALERALHDCVATGHVPMAVVATAGTTDLGAVDPIVEVAELCAAYGAWLHVDAAYGGGLLVSRRHGHLLAGIENADSVTVDYHKTWFQPVSSSALLVKDAASLAAVTWHADYLNPREATDPNQVDKSLQTTRRFDALKLWLTLRIMGPDTIGEYVDTVIDLAAEVHAALVDLDDLELAAAPTLSTLVLRFRPEGLEEDALAALNTGIRAELYAGGTGMVAATRLDGRQFLKLTLLNPLATAADILGIVEAIRLIGRDLMSRPTAPPAQGRGRITEGAAR